MVYTEDNRMGSQFFFFITYGWFLTMVHITEVMYLFLRVLDALQYLNCWGVSQLYDNFPSNTQNYSSRRVRAQTEGGMCKYRQSTKVTLQVHYETCRCTWPTFTVCMYCVNLLTVNPHISRCVHYRFDFPFAGLQRLHLDIGSYFILHTQTFPKQQCCKLISIYCFIY